MDCSYQKLMIIKNLEQLTSSVKQDQHKCQMKMLKQCFYYHLRQLSMHETKNPLMALNHAQLGNEVYCTEIFIGY